MNYLNEMIRRNTRDMLRRNWGKAVALTVTVMAVLLLGSMLESAIGGLTGTYELGTLLTIYRSSLSALTPAVWQRPLPSPSVWGWWNCCCSVRCCWASRNGSPA